ncbi:MAG: hypothetical protein IT290_00375 [Deltaproteobacteria bacterium]|nr:hypothetical protein [Deltaproteobacteria bacterium]
MPKQNNATPPPDSVLPAQVAKAFGRKLVVVRRNSPKSDLAMPPAGWVTRAQLAKRFGLKPEQKGGKREKVEVPQPFLTEARIACVKQALGMSATERALERDEIIQFARLARLSLPRVEHALTGVQGSGFKKDELKRAAKRFRRVLDTSPGMLRVGSQCIPVTMLHVVRVSLRPLRTLNPIDEAPAKGSNAKEEKVGRTKRR